jgi:hypothetical protein
LRNLPTNLRSTPTIHLFSTPLQQSWKNKLLEFDPTDHSLVSSPATLLSEANADVAPFRQRFIDSYNTPIADVWTPASNEGTTDTEPSESVLPTLHASSSVHQANIGNALRFVTRSVEGNHTRNEPHQCGYCDYTFNRTCDLK